MNDNGYTGRFGRQGFGLVLPHLIHDMSQVLGMTLISRRIDEPEFIVFDLPPSDGSRVLSCTIILRSQAKGNAGENDCKKNAGKAYSVTGIRHLSNILLTAGKPAHIP